MKTTLAAAVFALVVEAGTASAASPAPPVTVANPSLNVNVTNNPLPVSVTNATTNQNVTVTNAATNPVKTSIDRYPRTPYGDCIQYGESPTTVCPLSYTVPSDKRLVIETVSYAGNCSAGAQEFLHLLLGPVALSFVGTGIFSIVHNVRVVVDHDQVVGVNRSGSVGDCDPTRQELYLAGYLVSVDSPSLAP